MAPRLATALLLASAAVLAGCGELSNPDLEHGSVAGRVVGAAAHGGYAYPLGRPDLKVGLAPDGRFELEDQPAGPLSVVIFDGSTPGRAELVAVMVPEAGRVTVERNGDAAPVAEPLKMALAGTLVATLLPPGGAVAGSSRVAVQGTDQYVVGEPGAVVALQHLPAGTFTLLAQVDGYQPYRRTGVTVAAGVAGVSSFTPVDVPLDVAEGEHPGCAASGGQCRNGLLCSQVDGLCYQCLGDADCGAGGSCDVTIGSCQSPGGMNPAAICLACTADLQCGVTGACVMAAGASSGYCTRMIPSACPADPTAFACPSGMAPQAGETASECVCAPPRGCSALFSAFGAPCFESESCGSARGLAGGRCYGAHEDTPGYCTAPCAADADCIVPGFVCDTVTSHLCVKGP